MKNSTTKTHRTIIRSLVNRKKVYSLSRYVRNVEKIIGKVLTKGEVLTCLKHMAYENQLSFHMVNNFVVGCLTKVA